MAVSEVQGKDGGMKTLLPMGTMLTSCSFLQHQHTVSCMLRNTRKVMCQFNATALLTGNIIILVLQYSSAAITTDISECAMHIIRLSLELSCTFAETDYGSIQKGWGKVIDPEIINLSLHCIPLHSATLTGHLISSIKPRQCSKYGSNLKVTQLVALLWLRTSGRGQDLLIQTSLMTSWSG